MGAEEQRARANATKLCAELRARGDALSLNAAAEIEGTLEAFAGIVAAQIALREQLGSAVRSLRVTQELWGRVPLEDRRRAAHGWNSP